MACQADTAILNLKGKKGRHSGKPESSVQGWHLQPAKANIKGLGVRRTTVRGLYHPRNGGWAGCRGEFIRLFSALCANEFAPTINRIILFILWIPVQLLFLGLCRGCRTFMALDYDIHGRNGGLPARNCRGQIGVGEIGWLFRYAAPPARPRRPVDPTHVP
jgi:hypothetical protein